jgi:hypothetical protein
VLRGEQSVYCGHGGNRRWSIIQKQTVTLRYSTRRIRKPGLLAEVRYWFVCKEFAE